MAAQATELNGRYSQPALAGLTIRHQRTEDALTQEADEPLSLVEAAKASGLSDDYLGRLYAVERSRTLVSEVLRCSTW